MSDETLRAKAQALLDQRGGRGAIKRQAQALDEVEGLRDALWTAARQRGIALPEEARGWPAKRLLRRARAREEESRVRTNPIHRDEAFICAHCDLSVPPHGRTARDHCPRCLRSLHVDIVPGDRAAACGGILDPVSAETQGERVLLRYRCRRCGASRVNQALTDGDPADDWQAIIAVSAADPTGQVRDR